MEEYVSRFALGGISPGPELRHLSRNRVGLSRQIGATVTRRDPRRNATESAPLWNTYGVMWDFGFSQDDGSLALVLASLADDPAATPCAIGESVTLLQQLAHAALADGSEWKLENGILRDFQIIVEPKQPIRFSTAWIFGKLTEAAFPDAAETASGVHAGAVHAAFTLGGFDVPTFAGTIAFTRDALPAGFGLDGQADSVAGQMAVDIVGKITTRLDSANALLALRDRITTSLQLVITCGARTFTVVIPNATFQCGSRRIVGPGLTDYTLEFLALKTPTAPLATLTLT